MIPTSTTPSLIPGLIPRLILASSSAYRSQLLARLRLPFDAIAPEIDESALPGELQTLPQPKFR